MTKQKLPDICNFCSKTIYSEMQYSSEWFQGKTTFSDPRIRLKSSIDDSTSINSPLYLILLKFTVPIRLTQTPTICRVRRWKNSEKSGLDGIVEFE